MDDVSINHVKNELKEQSSIKIVIYEFTCAKIMNVVLLNNTHAKQDLLYPRELATLLLVRNGAEDGMQGLLV